MTLSIDFETLTLEEAELLEDTLGVGLDAIGSALTDPAAPKMKTMRALAAIAWKRENGGTFKKAMEAAGSIPLTDLTEGLEVSAEEHPTEESAQ